MSFTPPVRRVRSGRGHVYQDAAGRRVPGVTTLINDGVPKPALVKWAGRVVAECAVNRWDELAELPVAARLKTLQDAPWADRDAAANRGTEVHALAERLARGEQITVPDELAGHVDAYVRFLDDWNPTPVLLETVVVNYTVGYAGTLDGIVELPNVGRTLIDIKTGRSGVFGDVALQLAAYRYAEVYLHRDEERPMPPVDSCAVIHVRADGYSLVPVEAGSRQFRAFQYAMQVGAFVDGSRDLVGAELTPQEIA